MIYLKRFNESDHYWEIRNTAARVNVAGHQPGHLTLHGDPISKLISGPSKLSISQKKILNKIKGENTKLKYGKYNVVIESNSKTVKGGYGKGSWVCTTWKEWVIWVYEDDWFEVSERDMKSDSKGNDIDRHGRVMTQKNYKCDQWDGLIKLLKDKDLIK